MQVWYELEFVLHIIANIILVILVNEKSEICEFSWIFN